MSGHMRNENIGEERSVTADIREKCDYRHEKAEPLKIPKIIFCLPGVPGQFLGVHASASLPPPGHQRRRDSGLWRFRFGELKGMRLHLTSPTFGERNAHHNRIPVEGHGSR